MAKLVLLLSAIVFLQITPSYRGRQLNAEGIRLMQMDRAAEAEVQFRQAIQADPQNAEAVTNLGVALFKQGKFPESIPFFEQGVASRPRDASAHNDLAQAYVRVHRAHDAAAAMAHACDLEPNNPAYRRYFGDMLVEADDKPAAEKQLRLAVKLAPKSAESWLSLAKLLTREDRRDEALRAYQTSLELNRHQPDALRELGELHAFGGDFQKAEEEFRRGIAFDPNNALLHQDLGNSLLKSGKPVDAEPELREAVKLDSRAGLAHRDLGLALRDKGDLPGAIQEFRRAVALMPENGPVHYQFSQTLRRAGKKDEADREAAHSEKLSHEKEESAKALAYADQGLSLVQHGRTREGLAKIKQALAISPDNLTGHFDYALALRHVGRYDESIAHLQKVLLQQPDMPAAHYQLGCDYFRKGQYHEAVSYFYRAARLIPGTAVVHNGLGVALAKSGDISGAIGELQVARKLDPKTKLYGRNLDCVQRPSPGCGLTP